MQTSDRSAAASGQIDHLTRILQRYWGYASFRPLQEQAMRAVLDDHDSVVVLPTGGGKSLCFQAPAMCLSGLSIVVSPLISLMQDQVDTLQNCGVPAAFVNSTLNFAQRREIAQLIRRGEIRLLYIAPERLVTERTLSFLSSLELSTIAIDEAHCISAWGHDFRPEYRALSVLRDRFPTVGIHAYTATATPRVRTDIKTQLRLRDPLELVGSFDRPNLIYRAQPRTARLEQIREVLDRHEGESGIIYCITRRDVDDLTGRLTAAGYRALPYHAGMDDAARRRNQAAFMEESARIIVATVAFGMGIDKSNVRYVIHAGMPKSLENYQQESGRAGRDGLEAECCLFFSGQDFHTWKRIIENSELSSQDGALEALRAIWNYCGGVVCRHTSLISHFGQQTHDTNCQACDVCLGELNLVRDSLVASQKILSCVLRLDERYGGDYTAKVLTGSNDAVLVQRGHTVLSTYGLLADENNRTVRDWIEQLVGQGHLEKTGEYNTLCVTSSGRAVLRGEAVPRLLRPATAERSRKSAPVVDSWEGVDRGLFERLREVRRQRAQAQGVAPYMVFDDAALRDMARRRPASQAGFHRIRGVGEKKLADYGELFVQEITRYCAAHSLPSDCW